MFHLSTHAAAQQFLYLYNIIPLIIRDLYLDWTTSTRLCMSTSIIFEISNQWCFQSPCPSCWFQVERIARGMRRICDVIMWSLPTRIEKSILYSISYLYTNLKSLILWMTGYLWVNCYWQQFQQHILQIIRKTIQYTVRSPL